MSIRSVHSSDPVLRGRRPSPLGARLPSVLPALFLVAIAALLLLRGRFSASPSGRLAIYGFPLACSAFLLMDLSVRRGRVLRPVHASYFGPLLLSYLALIAVSLLVLTLSRVHVRFLQETVFILAPLITAGVFFVLFPARAPTRGCDTLLGVLFAGLYLLSKAPTPTALMDTFRWDVFLGSSLATESGFAFPLGMLTVYFATRRKWLVAVLTGTCLLLSYKRIALLATVAGLISFWSLSSTMLSGKRSRQVAALLGVVANLVLVFIIVQFGQGKYDRRIEHWFDVPANQFTMGRRYVQGRVLAGLDVPQDALGLMAALPKGLGSSSDYMVRSGIDRTPFARGGSLHSDLLKGLIEFGLLGFVAWIYVFYRVHSFSPTALALAVYWNVLWLTDNTLIYIDAAFVFYTLVGLAFVEQRSRAAAALPTVHQRFHPPTRTLKELPVSRDASPG